MSIFAALLEEAGHNPLTTAKHSTLGRIFLSEPVRESFEFERIDALPRRKWQDRPDLPELVERLSAGFAKNSTAKLFPVQAAALDELQDLRTCNGVVGLGGGKTLVTALAPLVLNAKRPLFLNYARL